VREIVLEPESQPSSPEELAAYLSASRLGSLF
jgi:hypothetical protein